MSDDNVKRLINGASGLHEEGGVYYSLQERELSYPDEGNDSSLELEETSFWFRHRNECICNAVTNFPPPVPVVFDVGGGNGFVSQGLQRSGVTAVVVEPMKSGAQNARNRDVSFVVCSTLGDAGFEEKSIPAVGLFDVLEHIEDDVGFLNDIAPLLRDDGRIYLTVPAYQWLWSRMDEVGGHHRRYTLKSLRKTFREAGYQCVFQSYFFNFLPLPMLVMRVLFENLGGRKEGEEMEQSVKEHKESGWIGSKILGLLCWIEVTWLRLRLPVPFGGSCLIVAKLDESTS